MKKRLRVFSTFEAGEEADRAYYASLSPQERLEIVLELIQRHRESMGETAERLERVYRIVERSRD